MVESAGAGSIGGGEESILGSERTGGGVYDDDQLQPDALLPEKKKISSVGSDVELFFVVSRPKPTMI